MSLKVTLNLEDLRGTFPHMIRNEIWTHCWACNLIRKTMPAAAVTHERTPRTLSFAGASQIVAGVLPPPETLGKAGCEPTRS